MSDDYNAGFDAGRRGNMFGPNTAAGTAGWLAGAAAGDQKFSGSAEWLVAPFALAPFVAIFYPLATVPALAVAFVVESIANASGLGASPGVRWVLVLVPMIAVFWTLCRWDQQLALRSRSYYLARHATRLVAFALLANGAAHNAAATAANLQSKPALQAMFSLPVYWLPVLLMLVFWQLLFMRAYHFRVYWNIKLKSWRLRPKDFPPIYPPWPRSARDVHQPQAPIPMPGRRD